METLESMAHDDDEGWLPEEDEVEAAEAGEEQQHQEEEQAPPPFIKDLERQLRSKQHGMRSCPTGATNANMGFATSTR